MGPFVLDFYSAQLNIAIEVDGVSHGGREAYRYDRQREAYLERRGISVIRISNESVFDPTCLIADWLADEIERVSRFGAMRK